PPAPLITSPIIGVGLQASINWGDGIVSAGTLVADTVPNEYRVRGAHTWSKPGTYNVTVMVVWGPLPGSPLKIPSVILATIHSSAIVRPDIDGPVTLSETAGKPFT